MSVFNYKTGLGNSSAYQVSAVPCVIRDEITHTVGPNTVQPVQEVNFTNVTNFIQISSSGDLNVGFSSLGITANENYFTIPAGVSDVYHWRVSSVYLQKTGSVGNRDYAIIAGLTTVPAAELSNNWSGSAGVG